MDQDHLPGITSRYINTKRLSQHLISKGADSGIPIVFVHGNFSSSTYFEALMHSMPEQYYCLAVDLRGYGDTEAKLIDATRGARDWADDLYELMSELGLGSAHWVGWSAGAAPIMQLCIDHPELVTSLTLVAPVSPFGFGGTKNMEGEPCFSDFAGSGGGVVGEDFIRQVRLKDQTRDHISSPLNVIHDVYFYLPQQLDREMALLNGSLKQQLGDKQYPGDSVVSANWPYVSPGNFGALNAVSAKFHDVGAFSRLTIKPPVLWIRGDQDVVISNRSLSDSAVLGAQGLIDYWPGEDVCPPQPMVDQMRYLLEQYQLNGGLFEEIILKDVGHSPFIEAPREFLTHFSGFLARSEA